MKTIWVSSLFLCILLHAFSVAAEVDPTFEHALKNLKLTGIGEEEIQLTNGRWEGAPYVQGGASRPTAGLAEKFLLEGDLDGDGQDEYVALVWQSSGGSGTFDYLALLRRDGDSLQNPSSAALGDRVQIRKAAIQNGAISLEVIQAGRGDAACCPQQLATRRWTLEDGQLKEQPVQITGELSLTTLQDTNWVLERLRHDNHLPSDVEITASFTDNRIAGSSGCNRYSAEIQPLEGAGEIAIGPAMGTRKACPEDIMQVESEFLELLSHVNRFSFVAGQLLLSGQKETYTFSLRFDPAN